MSEYCILVVGAGPTGLALALNLARREVPFRIISSAAGPGEHSRAVIVHARTLEFYSQLGFAEQAVNEGIVTEAIHLREVGDGGKGRDVGSFNVKDFGQGLSPYPFMLIYPQDDHERLLGEELKKLGVNIEWNTKLLGFEQDTDGVTATLSLADQTPTQGRFSYLCGCDGAHSQVRRTLALEFPGGTYQQLFYVADAKLEGKFDFDVHIEVGPKLFLLVWPVRSSGMHRLIGLVPPELSDRKDLRWEDVRDPIEQLIDRQATEVNWFSTYHVSHRVAERFNVGRVFLLGDAGHVHSPVGGQGMNTGIGDAFNLGWKLADVARGRASQELLETYNTERLAFARKLTHTTDAIFNRVIGEDARAWVMRRMLAPLAVHILPRSKIARHAMFDTISQIEIHYPESPLSQGRAGDVRGGDRLPWNGGVNVDNFEALRSCNWQLHVYGDVNPQLVEACDSLSLALHRFAWNEDASDAGFVRNGVYLIRPDGYVALAQVTADVDELRAFATRWGIRFSRSMTGSNT